MESGSTLIDPWPLLIFPALTPHLFSSLQSHLIASLFLSQLLCPPANSVSAKVFLIQSYVRGSVTVAYDPRILIDKCRDQSGIATHDFSNEG